jgi:hypothetical protein
MERDTEAAFNWIVDLLERHRIPFQISGGLAARIYGSDRPLADIDIGIPDSSFSVLLPEVEHYLIYGPKRYVDQEWDLNLMTLKYKNQKIDIAGRDAIQFFDKKSSSWVAGHKDLTVYEMREVYGRTVPVIPKNALIAYKKKLDRDVDLLDIQALESSTVNSSQTLNTPN